MFRAEVFHRKPTKSFLYGKMLSCLTFLVYLVLKSIISKKTANIVECSRNTRSGFIELLPLQPGN